MPREAPVTRRALADMCDSGSGGGTTRRRSADRRLDVAGELLRLLAGRIAPHHSKLPVDQELGEIPLDRLRAQEPGRFVFERLKQRMGVCAVDFDLREHRERHVEPVGAKLADCSFVPWLLMPNWSHGNPSTAKPRSRKRRCSASRPTYCGVKPHWLATLTISSVWPAKSPSVCASPSIVFIAMSGERDKGSSSANAGFS